MAGNLLNKYGSNNQAITITLASLTATSARASTAVDNSSNDFVDALVSVKVKTNASSGSTAQKAINVYVYGTTDGGTTYTEAATGSDAAITLNVPTNAFLLGVISATAAATSYPGGPWSVASAFGGSLPDHWGIIVENQTGNTLDATAGNHLATYQGVFGQYS